MRVLATREAMRADLASIESRKARACRPTWERSWQTVQQIAGSVVDVAVYPEVMTRVVFPQHRCCPALARSASTTHAGLEHGDPDSRHGKTQQ